MNTTTIPDAVHICQSCRQNLASGIDDLGLPRRCGRCFEDVAPASSYYFIPVERLSDFPAPHKDLNASGILIGLLTYVVMIFAGLFLVWAWRFR